MPLEGTVHGVDDDIEFSGVDFISFVAYDTFGKPAIIAPGTDNYARRDRVTVLYVNPGNIQAMEVKKT